MDKQKADLVTMWPLEESVGLRDELLAAYAEPSRGYHNTQHLTEVLARLDELADHGVSFDQRVVRLAAWFHDSVYAGKPDDEEQSALWAQRALSGLIPDHLIDEVARLVRLTKTHRPVDDDANGSALCDADLAILAAPPKRYAEYTQAVRVEYKHVRDPDFRAGRTQILRTLVDKPHLFHTDYAHKHWEDIARANLERELATLVS
ncbi:hypothetical protein BD410DRAFT_829023 [Rickenella mellea]|uniref:HD domain-containing protein n=1 Tax=Rickenella mellea TaxID=50990 RepID=A0A4Y7Q1K2_9AGAM|nr:hypothetical protein BD410DRAFT_829023 [Rickenella mellea]